MIIAYIVSSLIQKQKKHEQRLVGMFTHPILLLISLLISSRTYSEDTSLSLTRSFQSEPLHAIITRYISR